MSNNENNSKNYYVVGDFMHNNEVEENFFEEQIEDAMEVPPKTTLNPKVVRAINKIIEWAEQEKAMKENLIFSLNLATKAEEMKSAEEELSTFNRALNHPIPES